jgi:GT2 family glycosyltransferase
VASAEFRLALPLMPRAEARGALLTEGLKNSIFSKNEIREFKKKACELNKIGQGEQDQIIREGEDWCARSKGDYFTSERLDFFCVAIRKTVFDKLGGFDERFGMGYYEDVDFSTMAGMAGFRMMFTEDCFIFHRGSKTFDEKMVKRLMHENKRKIMEKYSGRIKLYPTRDRNMNIMKQYLLIKRAGNLSRVDDLDYKFNNHLLLAKTLYPHNPFKKLLYFFQLRSLCSNYFR